MIFKHVKKQDFGRSLLDNVIGVHNYIHGLDDPKNGHKVLFGGSIKEFPIERGLKEDEVLLIPPFSVKVLYTPGHTQGSVCYYIEGAVFTGDTLFAGSYGRTDFPGGSEPDLIRSINEKIFSISGDRLLYPGHGDSTTLKHERLFNPIARL